MDKKIVVERTEIKGNNRWGINISEGATEEEAIDMLIYSLFYMYKKMGLTELDVADEVFASLSIYEGLQVPIKA